jgi:MT0933-like antitoxin protein
MVLQRGSERAHPSCAAGRAALALLCTGGRTATHDQRTRMGILDKVKGLVGSNKEKVEGGIDKAADVAKGKLPDEHDAKVDKAADTLKGQIDKLDG